MISPEQMELLLQAAADFSRGDTEVMAAVQASLREPPRTTESVGFYLSGKETEFENCFRHLVSQLEPYTTYAEDKYVYEIFGQWFGEGRLLQEPPAELVRLLPELLASDPAREDGPHDSSAAAERATARIRSGYDEAMRAVEQAFDAAGQPLLSFDLGGGDTLFFINVDPAVAERWRGKVVGHTYDGQELALRAPMWDAFRQHLAYAFGLDLDGD